MKKTIEMKVMELVACAQFDNTSQRWLTLPEDARNIISEVLLVNPADRLSASRALKHPYLCEKLNQPTATNSSTPLLLFGQTEWCTVRQGREQHQAWNKLDGFQRLSWAAVARATGESEMRHEIVASALNAMEISSDGDTANGPSYLWQLARELSARAVGMWLRDWGAWAEVLRLAFRYLDLDDDGVLSPEDLKGHLVTKVADATAEKTALSCIRGWVAKWGTFTLRQNEGLSPDSFRKALVTSTQVVNIALRASPVGDDNEFETEVEPGFGPGHNSRVEELCTWSDITDITTAPDSEQ